MKKFDGGPMGGGSRQGHRVAREVQGKPTPDGAMATEEDCAPTYQTKNNFTLQKYRSAQRPGGEGEGTRTNRTLELRNPFFFDRLES